MIMKLNPPGVFLKRWELLLILASIFLGVQLSYSGSRLDLMHVSEIANGPDRNGGIRQKIGIFNRRKVKIFAFEIGVTLFSQGLARSVSPASATCS